MCGLTSFNRCATNINASASGLLGDCPDKACQLARDRGGDHGRWLTCPCKLAIPPAKSFLRLPRDIADRLGQTFRSQQLLAADLRREPIAPGSLNEHPPRCTVASLCDAALASRAAASIRPRYAMSWRGLPKRVMSPSSAN